MKTFQTGLKWLGASAYLWIFINLALGLFTFIFRDPGASGRYFLSALVAFGVSFACYILSGWYKMPDQDVRAHVQRETTKWKRKNAFLAAFLAFIGGPLGLTYLSWKKAVVGLVLVSFAAGFFTAVGWVLPSWFRYVALALFAVYAHIDTRRQNAAIEYYKHGLPGTGTQNPRHSNKPIRENGLRITAAEAGKVMAAAAAKEVGGFSTLLGKHGTVNDLEVWGLNLFCVAFGAELALNRRLSQDTQRELFHAFYATTYDIAVRTLRLNQLSESEFVEWLVRKFQEYDPLARQILLERKPLEFSFGDVVVKNTLGKEGDSVASLRASMLVMNRILAAAKVWTGVQFMV